MAALGWLPLLLLAPAYALQPGPPSPTLELCRIDVSPCQREVNLAAGEEATLALSVRIPESANVRAGQLLVAWHSGLKVMGSDVIDLPDAETTGLPFREQAGPQAALAGMKPLNAGPQAGPATGSYYRIKNSYTEVCRRLEYAIAVVADGAEQQPHSQLGLQAGQEALLGTFTLRGTGTGTALLSVDSTKPAASKLVLMSNAGELSTADVAAREPLARVNVGPYAEKLRLEGRVLSDVPDGVDSHQPFTRSFRIEVWNQGAVPAWRGGTDLPLATFYNVRPDDNGKFAVRDLPTEFLQAGAYDLRAIGGGTLSYLYRDLQIESSLHQSGYSPQVVSVVVGPFPSGDLDGDNLVDDNDLSRLKSNFGREVQDTDAGPLADFNADGVIDGQDFSLMAANYGRRGG